METTTTTHTADIAAAVLAARDALAALTDAAEAAVGRSAQRVAYRLVSAARATLDAALAADLAAKDAK
jgi:hypothetical protein